MNEQDQKTIKLVKKIILGVIVFFMLLPLFGLLASCETEQVNKPVEVKKSSKPVAEVKKSSKPVEVKKSSKPVTEVKPSSKPVDTRLSIDIAMNILKNSYKGIADVRYISKDKIIEIECTDKNFMYSVLLAKQGDKKTLKQWNVLINALKDTSRSVDKNIMIALVNSMNSENYIYSCQNGITIYDYVNN